MPRIMFGVPLPLKVGAANIVQAAKLFVNEPKWIPNTSWLGRSKLTKLYAKGL